MRFTCGGDLGEWSDAFFVKVASAGRMRRCVNNNDNNTLRLAQTLQQPWRGRKWIGIIAKKAGQAKHARALDLGPSRMAYSFDVDAEQAWKAEDVDAIWQWIFHLKFRDDASLRQVLLNKNPLRLIQYDKGSVVSKKLSFWGGVVDKTSGAVRGRNVIGRALMHTRDVL